jgi:hypothetical protein
MVAMDNKLIKQILVVAVALLFIASSFYFGGPIFSGSNNGISGENITGTILFNGTIRTYDPILGISGDINDSLVNEIRNMDGVKNVRPGQNGYIIDTETRDDVFILASDLREKGLEVSALANIALPSELELQFGTQTMNVTPYSSRYGSLGAVQVILDPIVDAGEEVTVSMIRIVNNGQLISYSNAAILVEVIQMNLQAEVNSTKDVTYSYTIPWENRTSVTGEDYNRIDSLIFSTPLTPTQIVTKKQFSYITYIDENSAMVMPNFINKSKVLMNFQDVNLTFPSSTYTTNESLGLPFNHTIMYEYDIKFEAPEGYLLGEKTISLKSPEELNDTITLNVSAVVIGNNIISFESVSLPS